MGTPGFGQIPPEPSRAREGGQGRRGGLFRGLRGFGENGRVGPGRMSISPEYWKSGIPD